MKAVAAFARKKSSPGMASVVC